MLSIPNIRGYSKIFIEETASSMNVLNKTSYKQAFVNNFYSSHEYISFCNVILGKKGFTNIIDGKNISISNYSKKEMDDMKKNDIEFMSVLLKPNKTSLEEYPLWLYRSYDQAYKSFDKTFRKYSKRAEKQGYAVQIKDRLDKNEFKELYTLYIQHMRRLNGTIFPKTFFVEFNKLPSSHYLLVYHKTKIVGYSCFFQYKDNMYTSIGAGHKDYFDKYINYKLYHEKIKYACENKLNIHMGMGIKDSGYNAFKKRVGAVSLECVRHPDDTEFLKKVLPLTKHKWFGVILEVYSRLAPKKSLFMVMPFT